MKYCLEYLILKNEKTSLKERMNGASPRIVKIEFTNKGREIYSLLCKQDAKNIIRFIDCKPHYFKNYDVLMKIIECLKQFSQGNKCEFTIGLDSFCDDCSVRISVKELHRMIELLRESVWHDYHYDKYKEFLDDLNAAAIQANIFLTGKETGIRYAEQPYSYQCKTTYDK